MERQGLGVINRDLLRVESQRKRISKTWGEGIRQKLETNASKRQKSRKVLMGVVQTLWRVRECVETE